MNPQFLLLLKYMAYVFPVKSQTYFTSESSVYNPIEIPFNTGQLDVLMCSEHLYLSVKIGKEAKAKITSFPHRFIENPIYGPY